MNEEIRNSEIREEELEAVSGGYNAPLMCGRCGGKMTTLRDDNGNETAYYCRGCGLRIEC